MEAATLRKVVWEEMLFANMRANYFAELLRRYQKRDKWLKVAVLVASSGAVGTTLVQLDAPWKLAAPILAAAGSFWLLISQYSTLARDAADLHSGWSAAARDYERLWNHLGDTDAEVIYHQIYDRGETLGKAAGKFPYKSERLEYWLDQAAMLATARYV